MTLNAEGLLDTPLIDQAQLEWFGHEMQNSSARKRRGDLDWIIVCVHRPLYCSSGSKECGEYAQYLRGLLEQTIQENLVDLVVSAHRHNYERSTPVFLNKVMPNSSAPVYIVNGIGGCREGNSPGMERNRFVCIE